MLGLLIGTAAVGFAGYAAYAPRSQLYGRTYLGTGPGSRQLALTYDDGPNDPYTLGKHSTLWRPPFGARLPHVLRAGRNLGLEPVMWTVSSNDWRIHSADAIELRLTQRIRGGDVILMHDGAHVRLGLDRARTVEATDRLIRRCTDQGYEFVTVPEMMEVSGDREIG